MQEYSPTAVHVLDDPAAAYAELRSHCPVHFHEGMEHPLYTLAKTSDIVGVLTDSGTWSNRQGPGITKSLSVGDVQRDDPPEHTHRRQFLRDPFLPSALAATTPSIRMLAQQLADDLAKVGSCELHDQFALALPVASFCALLGVDIEDRDLFSRWADEMVAGMTYPERGVEGRRGINAFSRSQIEQRRALAEAGEALPDGFLSYLATAPYGADGSVMDLKEATNTVSQFLVAGHETTTSLITNLMWRLLEDPARWAAVVANPSLIEAAVEESLRFDPPVLGLCRTNNVAVNLSGVDIPEDSKVMVLYAAPNRDPDLFTNPDEFRLDRPMSETRRHLSFSWGIHYCLGAGMARLTARIAIETLAEQFPTMRLVGPTERVEAPFLWGRKRLPVAWDIAPHPRGGE
jgi:cytochrome P450